MNIYKVCQLTRWGHEDNVSYFKSPISAEKDFHKRVKKAILTEELPTRDQLDGGPPWKIRIGGKRFNKQIKMSAEIRYWDSCHTDCGTEYDIEGYDILFEQITVA